MQDDLQDYIATRIKYFRKERQISQEKLAELAGLGAKAVQHIEGRKYDFKIQTISKILVALNISKEEFFELPTFKENHELIVEFMNSLKQLSNHKQKMVLQSFIDILKNIE
ncbi:helix-turn-helix domain-containing protein [Granulicatella sp. zg-ZJ]|uniref:helix-turn-helix domain-containing protein n=1 Tax=Granulicatella sp. zg-ZJ TaxID=2678504 RepID=UPI0013D11A94|nr:helix-turn-helix transcriptional regulator [Granulicatella sp. zg-ZJ]MBS4751155.1 helix-turn-helix transcriptional regulator [Carnobacteriaceae bacterium zg-ZUI78]NEW63336.1 helix-turn-helix domain-containing protein [Granulicatella sp. zg-ZJ]